LKRLGLNENGRKFEARRVSKPFLDFLADPDSRSFSRFTQILHGAGTKDVEVGVGAALEEIPVRKRIVSLFECFPDVCPEPVSIN
jgi:hypothetical protein